MDQRNFDFSQNESHPYYLQLNETDQQTLIELMSQLIASVYHTQENTYEQSTSLKQDQD